MSRPRVYCDVVRKIFREEPRLLVGVALWLLGYSRLDVWTLLNVDLSDVVKYGVIVDEFRDVVKVCGLDFKRFSRESVEQLIGECLAIDDILSLIDRVISDEERKILAYVSDYVERMSKFSIYGVSDYIRCSELIKNVNVEYKVLCTVVKSLLYACDRTYVCDEYSWTRVLIKLLHSKLSSLVKLPSDSDIESRILSLITEREDGMNIVAAMYSLSTGSTDQFHSFHRRPVQEYLSKITSIQYVFHDGFLNGLALPIIEKVFKKFIIEPLLAEICNHVGECSVVKSEESRFSYRFDLELKHGHNISVVAPKMYYYSPVFWAVPRAVNVLYEIPHSVQAYLTVYRPYFEDGVLVLARGTKIVKIVCFGENDLCGMFIHNFDNVEVI